jgi:Arc/MetJ-type ribon-helix-helix transcriptional regulator
MKHFVGFRISDKDKARIESLIVEERYKSVSDFMNKAIENMLKIDNRKDSVKDFLDTEEGTLFVKQLITKIQDKEKSERKS